MRQPTRSSQVLGDLLLTLPFLLFFFLQLLHHQLWRDEINVFAIAQVSPNLRTLLFHLHYEGHPWLWYVLVWLLSKIATSVESLKILAAISGTALYLLIGLVSPFRRWEKVLLFLSYFVVFEYSLFARMYGLQLVLVMLYLWRRARNPRGVVGNALLLSAVASLDMTGLILAFSFAAEYLWSLLRGPIEPRVPRARIVAGVVLLAFFTVLSVASLLPTQDLSAGVKVASVREHPKNLGIILIDYLVKPYLPTFRLSSNPYWDPKVDHSIWVLGVCLPFVLAAYWLIFRRHKRQLFILGSATVLSLTFAVLFYPGYLRHFGITFVAFVAGLWMLRAAGDEISWPACVLLALTALGGIDASLESWMRPISNAGVAAKFLADPRLMALPWAGYPDYSVASLSTFTGHPIFQLECRCIDTYYLQSKRRRLLQPEQVAPTILEAYRSLGAPEMVYVTTDPPQSAEMEQLRSAGLHLKLLKTFTGAVATHEDYSIYDVTAAK